MAEKTSYYTDQNGVRVTDKRVIVNNVTYAMANITSVSTTVEKPSVVGPVVLIVLGASMILASVTEKSGGEFVFGGIVGAIGYLWYRGRKPIWHLRIASASGEATPLKSVNQQWIGGIVHAINEAMIHRT